MRVSRTLLQIHKKALYVFVFVFMCVFQLFIDMEVKLWKDKLEREMYDSFAELSAIVKATERLEKAYYVPDIIAPHDYDSDCQNLFAHFNTLAASTLKDSSVPNIADTYGMDSPAAINQAAAVAFESSSAAIVAQCVQNFITAMDSLKLNMVAVDKVHPLLSDLYASLNKFTILSPGFEVKSKMKE